MTRHRWPANQRSVVFLSVNFDAESFDLKMAGTARLFGRFSYGRYGVRAGLPRLLGLLERQEIAATFFVPASDARRHPDLVRRLVEEGHEVAARGVDLEDLSKLGSGEYDVLKEARDILADIAGTAPLGFRAPGGNLSVDTLRHLADLGFLYDASFQDADYPYRIEVAPGRVIVEVPSSAALDDAPAYSARHTHARLIRIWRDEFAAMYEEGTLVPLTVHLRGDIGSTRAARIAALEELLTDMRGHGDVGFATGLDLAKQATTQNLAPEADPVSCHRATLSVTPYRGDLSVKPL